MWKEVVVVKYSKSLFLSYSKLPYDVMNLQAGSNISWMRNLQTESSKTINKIWEVNVVCRALNYKYLF